MGIKEQLDQMYDDDPTNIKTARGIIERYKDHRFKNNLFFLPHHLKMIEGDITDIRHGFLSDRYYQIINNIYPGQSYISKDYPFVHREFRLALMIQLFFYPQNFRNTSFVILNPSEIDKDSLCGKCGKERRSICKNHLPQPGSRLQLERQLYIIYLRKLRELGIYSDSSEISDVNSWLLGGAGDRELDSIFKNNPQLRIILGFKPFRKLVAEETWWTKYR